MSKPCQLSTTEETEDVEVKTDLLLRVLCVLCGGASQSAAVSTIGDGRRIILCRSAPAGTIGNTESSCSTWKSMTVARRERRASCTAAATSARCVTATA